MYVVAIAWIYVTILVALTQPTLLRGILTFLGVGLAPLALWLWLIGTPQRRRARARRAAAETEAGCADSVDPDR